MRTGIHRFYFNDQLIELMYSPSSHSNSNEPRVLLVSLKAAVPARESKKGPFFTGKNIAAELCLPLASVADPIVSTNTSVGLAWYAGSEKFPDLPARIAEILNGLAKENGFRLVFFGGSGAGFAILSILSHLTAEAVALIWNPQTSIGRYDRSTVWRYLHAAFPLSLESLPNELKKDPISVANLESILTRLGIDHDLTNWHAKKNVKVLYLQNADDWHVSQHLLPFMKNGSWARLGDRSFACPTRGVYVWLGAWGEGHIEPPPQLITNILGDLCNGIPVEALTRNLSSRSPTSSTPPWIFNIDGGGDLFHVDASFDGVSRIQARGYFDTTLLPAAVFQYAFDLMIGGNRMEVMKFNDSGTLDIQIHADAGPIILVAYARDSIGGVISRPVVLPFNPRAESIQ